MEFNLYIDSKFAIKGKSMKSEEIIVTVTAESGVGKTRLIMLLNQFLQEQGFETAIILNEIDDREVLNDMESLPLVIDSIKQKARVVFKEEQVTCGPINKSNG